MSVCVWQCQLHKQRISNTFSVGCTVERGRNATGNWNWSGTVWVCLIVEIISLFHIIICYYRFWLFDQFQNSNCKQKKWVLFFVIGYYVYYINKTEQEESSIHHDRFELHTLRVQRATAINLSSRLVASWRFHAIAVHCLDNDSIRLIRTKWEL